MKIENNFTKNFLVFLVTCFFICSSSTYADDRRLASVYYKRYQHFKDAAVKTEKRYEHLEKKAEFYRKKSRQNARKYKNIKKNSSEFLDYVPYSRVSYLKEMPVDFYVIRDGRGQGNEKWMDPNYVRMMLKEATEKADFVNFKLRRIIEVRNDRYFHARSQMPALRLATRYSRRGVVSVAISGEKTKRTAGLAWIQYRWWPAFAMRSRFNKPDQTQYSKRAFKNTAGIFVHELGHNMGLRHRNRNRKIHTENYYMADKEKNRNLSRRLDRRLSQWLNRFYRGRW